MCPWWITFSCQNKFLLAERTVSCFHFLSWMIGKADIEVSKATSLLTLGCHKPVTTELTCLTPCSTLRMVWRIDRPHFCGHRPHWRLLSSRLLPFVQTADFRPPWAKLGTPALLFDRCAAQPKTLCFKTLSLGRVSKATSRAGVFSPRAREPPTYCTPQTVFLDRVRLESSTTGSSFPIDVSKSVHLAVVSLNNE